MFSNRRAELAAAQYGNLEGQFDLSHLRAMRSGADFILIPQPLIPAMEATGYEVVYVIDERSLVDSESYQHPYRRRDKPLEPGFYIVIAPDQEETTCYDESAEFIGPFESAAVARATMEGPQSIESVH